MTPRGWIILALIVAAVILVLWGLRHSLPITSPMRTADEKQIERETAAIQRQVPDPRKVAGCDVVQFGRSREVSRDWARANASKAARQEELNGTPPVNPYHPSDPEYVEWAVELAEYRTALHYAQPKFQQPV